MNKLSLFSAIGAAFTLFAYFWSSRVAENPSVTLQTVVFALFFAFCAIFHFSWRRPEAKLRDLDNIDTPIPKAEHCPDTSAIDDFFSQPNVSKGAVTTKKKRKGVTPRDVAGWRIIACSPFDDQQTTSWIGGTPKTPQDFVWPSDEKGDPMHFIAQIDLSKIVPEPKTQQRPNLPHAGAMLIFLGRSKGRMFAHILLLDAAAQATWKSMPAPETLSPIRDINFETKGTALAKSPVALVPFLDGPKATFPAVPLAKDWIVNWGIAAYEAKIALKALEQNNESRARHNQLSNLGRADAKPPQLSTQQLQTHSFLEEHSPALTRALRDFATLAESQTPTDAIDPYALSEITKRRESFANKLGRTPLKSDLLYKRDRVAFALWNELRNDKSTLDIQAIPEAFHPLLTGYITTWRGHRLFGCSKPQTSVSKNLDGLSSVFVLYSDSYFETQSEHEDGVSIWCDSKGLKDGRFDNNLTYPHTVV